MTESPVLFDSKVAIFQRVQSQNIWGVGRRQAGEFSRDVGSQLRKLITCNCINWRPNPSISIRPVFLFPSIVTEMVSLRTWVTKGMDKVSMQPRGLWKYCSHRSWGRV